MLNCPSHISRTSTADSGSSIPQHRFEDYQLCPVNNERDEVTPVQLLFPSSHHSGASPSNNRLSSFMVPARIEASRSFLETLDT